jgi:nuclease S1
MAGARSVSSPFARDVRPEIAFKELRMSKEFGRWTTAGAAALGAMASLCCVTTPAYAWGDEGHEIIALIADHYLDPAVRRKVNSILATDTSGLTPNQHIDMEATWADKFRDSDRNTTKVHYNETHNWHFVDLEIAGPDLKSACFGQPPLNGALASNGPANDCIVDKIDEFTAELKNPATSDQERLLALQFILHFVGDLHQPLHASDNHDQGGNADIVKAATVSKKPGKLHGFWDTQFVAMQGRGKTAIANNLIARITAAQRAQWSAGTAADWAKESFAVSKVNVYGPLPPPTSPNHYTLPKAYVTNAKGVVATQLSKAGVRLAFVLNNALQ